MKFSDYLNEARVNPLDLDTEKQRLGALGNMFRGFSVTDLQQLLIKVIIV